MLAIATVAIMARFSYSYSYSYRRTRRCQCQCQYRHPLIGLYLHLLWDRKVQQFKLYWYAGTRKSRTKRCIPSRYYSTTSLYRGGNSDGNPSTLGVLSEHWWISKEKLQGFLSCQIYQGEDVRSKVLNGGGYDKLDSKIILFMIDWFVHSFRFAPMQLRAQHVFQLVAAAIAHLLCSPICIVVVLSRRIERERLFLFI